MPTSAKTFATGCCGGCMLVLVILGYFAGSVVMLYYSAKAWHDEKDADTSPSGCSAAMSWNKFITIWSGIICYGLFVAAKQSSKESDIAEHMAKVVVLWLFGVGFGFGTYDKYYNICDSPDMVQTMKSIEVFMYFWLSVAGTITFGGIVFAAVSWAESCSTPMPTTSPTTYTPPGARQVGVSADTTDNNEV